MNTSSNIRDYIGQDTHHNGIIRVDYSKYAQNQTRSIQKNWIDDQAVKRLYQEGISIDSIESLDLDDAIWAERTTKGYVVFVHISDVTEAIHCYTPLDIEALKRTTSIYRWEWVINMFPPLLSQNILSLDENGEKLTLSIRVELNHEGRILDFSVYESLFKNLRRYDPETFMDDYINPDSRDHESLQLLYEIATRRKNIRRTEWATMDYDESDRQLSVEKKEERIITKNKAIPRSIIEEFMILANIASAMIAVKHGYNSIFRIHAGVEERAYYDNAVGLHAWLALANYSHFTSPIRRYADMVKHRVLKLQHLRGEPAPYTSREIDDIAKHINLSRTIIDILWKNYDQELRGAKIVEKIRLKNPGEVLNVSHFTRNLRDMIWAGKKIPEVVVKEIIQDLESGEKSNWAWAIGVFLVSKNDLLKQYLKKALLDDKKFRAKAVLSILNASKITSQDTVSLFHIEELEVGNTFSITVYFQWKLLAKRSINYGKFEKNDAIGMVRNIILRKIVLQFCAAGNR